MKMIVPRLILRMEEFKVVIFGQPQTGKTAFVRRQLGIPVSQQYIPTVGAEVHRLESGVKLFDLWDTAGVERFRGLFAYS